MKTLKTTFFALALILTAESCAQKQLPQGVTAAQVDSLSYAIGVSMGTNFRDSKLTYLNMDEFTKAIEDVIAGKDLKIDMAQANMVIQSYFMKMQAQEQEAMAAKAVENLEAEKKFLEENKTKEGVVALESGLQYKVLTEGTGPKPAAEDMVEVNYVGTLLDGTEFDSSYQRGETAKFPLNRVIKGWTEGIQLFGEGSKFILYVPAALGYGDRPMGDKIAPNSTLIFEVELIKVNPEANSPEAK